MAEDSGQEFVSARGVPGTLDTVFTDQNGNEVTRRGSAPVRNNNPASLIFTTEQAAGAAGAIGVINQGIDPVSGRPKLFAIFPTEEAGRQAQANRLDDSDIQNSTIAEAMRKLSPASDGNDPVKLAESAADAALVTVDTLIRDLTPEQFQQVKERIRTNESSNIPALEFPTNEPPQTTQVRRGETLSSVADRLGTTAPRLLEANPEIADPDFVNEGQFLRIPPPPIPRPKPPRPMPTEEPDEPDESGVEEGGTGEDGTGAGGTGDGDGESEDGDGEGGGDGGDAGAPSDGDDAPGSGDLDLPFASPMPPAAPLRADPLVLDLDGDGVETRGLDAGIYFDHDANAFRELTGFAAADDGLLARDLDGDGRITTGRELFGDQTLLRDGALAQHGFQALAELDENGDGVINAADAGFAELRVFRDANQNGVTDAGELLSLEDAGVRAIRLQASASTFVDASGSQHRLVGSFETSEGAIRDIADVFFEARLSQTLEPEIEVPDSVAGLPNTRGVGTVRSLHQALARDTSGTLEALVVTFIQSTDRAERLAAVEDIVFFLTGQEGEARPYENKPIDARVVGALAALFGEPLPQSLLGNHPNLGPLLEGIFADVVDSYYFQLSAQTKLIFLFDLIDFEQDPGTGAYSADLGEAIVRLLDTMTIDPGRSESLIHDFVQSLRGIDPRSPVLLAQFRQQLAQALADPEVVAPVSRQAIALAATVAANANIFEGGRGDDTLIGTGGGDVVLGGDGRDTLDGGFGDDFLSGGAGDDVLRGGSGHDHLIGGAGDDALDGHHGRDIYYFTRGDGSDRIVEAAFGETDRLVFTDVRSDQLWLEQTESGLRIRVLGTTDSVTLVGWTQSGRDSVELIETSDGARLERADLALLLEAMAVLPMPEAASIREDPSVAAALLPVLAAAQATVFGSYESETLVYARGNGDRTVVERAHEGDADTLELRGVEASAVDLVRDGNDVTLVIVESSPGAGDGGSILLKDSLDDRFGLGVESIRFVDGTVWSRADLRTMLLAQAATSADDTVQGFNVDDVLRGAGGDDALHGAAGNDLYLYRRGDGHDTLTEAAFQGTADRLALEDIAASEVSLARSGNHVTLVIAESSPGAGDGGSVLLQDSLDENFGQGVESIAFADGTVWSRADVQTMLLAQAATAGDDVVQGFNTDDVLRGGGGNDQLRGAAGNDRYVYRRGDGDDAIIEAAFQGVDELVLEGVTASEVTLVRAGNDVTLLVAESSAGAGDGGSILLRASLEESFDQGVERVSFADGTMWSRADLRTMLLARAATAGDDVVQGFNTDDVLQGGRGDDQLSGGAGNDRYVYRRGDGHDAITEASFQGVDELVLEGITAAEVAVSRVGNDLLLTIAESSLGAADSGSVLLRASLDENFGQGVERVVLGDGTVWTREALRTMLISFGGTAGNDTIDGSNVADVLSGGLGDDALNGRGGDDLYLYRRGDGHDTLTEAAFQGTADRLVLEDIAASEVSLARSGNHGTLVIAESSPGAGDGGSVLLRDSLDENFGQGVESVAFADGTVWSRADVRTMLLAQAATASDDIVQGFNTDDVLRGGAGNDQLSGAAGNDRYVWRRGDGDDTITEAPFQGTDQLVLEAIAAYDVSLARSGNHVTLVIAESSPGAGDGGSVLLRDSLDENFGQGVESIAFADGTVWSRADLRTRLLAQAVTAGDEVVQGFNTDDVLAGGGGNDQLSGAAGNDLYLYRRGDGHDTLTEAAFQGTADRLVLEDIAASEVSLARSGNHVTLVIAESSPGAGDGGSALLRDSLDESFGQGVESVAFADGTVWSRADVRTMLLAKAATAGDDVVQGFNTDDVLRGGAGNDHLNGAAGNDRYVWRRGDGDDTIMEAPFQGTDQLVLEAIAASDVSLARSGNHVTLVIAESSPGAGDGASIQLRDSLDESFNQGVESIVFADGTAWSRADLRTRLLAQAATDGDDVVRGFNTDDVLLGGVGNDQLSGDAGNDRYVWRRGDGHDTITEVAHQGAADQLVLEGVVSGDVSIVREGSDLRVIVAASSPGADDGGSILLDETFQASFGRGVDQLVFADGTVWSSAMLTSRVFTGTSGDDILSGTEHGEHLSGGAGNDALFGGAGRDVIEGGTGDDVLTGGLGDDRFVFRRGDGADRITDFVAGAGSEDVIDVSQIGLTTFEDVLAVATQQGSDVVLQLDPAMTLRVQNVQLDLLHADDFLFSA
jgi:Ca2+-binding RTX toxin-like protein/LysM repeat protein